MHADKLVKSYTFASALPSASVLASMEGWECSNNIAVMNRDDARAFIRLLFIVIGFD
jgi:hypothetical protein